MPSPMKHALVCPECSTAMDRVERNGHEVDVCSDCQAVWLDPGEVQALTPRRGFDLDQFERSLSARQRPSQGFRCLCCRRDLHLISSQGVAANVCACGGVFLSGDAVRQIEGVAKARFSAAGSAFDVASSVPTDGDLFLGVLEVLGELLSGVFSW